LITKSGFYVIKDEFFDIVNDSFLKDNKEGNRPHYYCFEDEITGIYWMIPLSSRVEKYQKIINKVVLKRKVCDILMIAKLDDDRTSVFLIQDMFPVIEQYIEREYTIAGNHLVLTSEHTVIQLERKARKVLKLIKNGVKLNPTQPDAMKIYNSIKKELDK